jgi:cobalt-zinc-cadmium efflux system protein
LALLADSGHLLSDTLSLAVALLATWIARLPASIQAPFGYRRVEILAALANGLGLVAIASWIAWEAIARLQSPPNEILSLPMLITAVVGLAVNSLNAWFLHRDSHHDLNLRGAFLHMVADAISSVGVILAAIAVGRLHWLWADGAISLLVAGFIATGAIPLIQQSLNILLERTPQHIDVHAIETTLTRYEAVVSVDALKLWTVALGQEVLWVQLQVSLKDGLARDRLLEQIQTQMQQQFGLQDVMVQMTLAVGQQAIAAQLSPPLSDQIVLPR